MREFSLQSYRQILLAARDGGYRMTTVQNHHREGLPGQQLLLTLRHDVDRRPNNAVAMAMVEAELNITATYYFRVVPGSFDARAIEIISNLGHEIGYHYEDFYLARYNTDRALHLFSEHLSKIRKLAPVKTISMHGSPLSKHSNLSIWQNLEFESFGVRDCTLSFDWGGHVYFTDTGRTFGQTRANLRDEVGGMVFNNIRSNRDLENFLRDGEYPLVLLNTHPERWDDTLSGWTGQYLRDLSVNAVKRVLSFIRNKNSYTP